MKKYTYTNMRTELSDILDILRSGESVTITQRGKPDVVLQGFPASQVNDNLHNEVDTSKASEITSDVSSVQSWVGIPSSLKEAMKVMQQPGLKEFQALTKLPAFKPIMSIDEIPAFKSAKKFLEEMQKVKPNLSLDFLQALHLTQTKHAKVIKKLEDK